MNRELGAVVSDFKGQIGGGLSMDRNAWEWVPDDPVRAMEFLVAGMAAERVLLGHNLLGNFSGDLQIWAWGVTAGKGVENGNDPLVVVRGKLGEPMKDIVVRVTEMVRERAEQVQTVAVAMFDFEEWLLTNDEVLDLL